jgi:uncharacterized protein YfiM (DUF2279 family)
MLPTLADDKANHLIYGLAIYLVVCVIVSLVTMNPGTGARWGFWTSLAIGVAKEWWDRRHGGDPSWRDAAATIAGGGFGFACTHLPYLVA